MAEMDYSSHFCLILTELMNHLIVCPQRSQHQDLNGVRKNQCRNVGRHVPNWAENTFLPCNFYPTAWCLLFTMHTLPPTPTLLHLALPGDLISKIHRDGTAFHTFCQRHTFPLVPEHLQAEFSTWTGGEMFPETLLSATCCHLTSKRQLSLILIWRLWPSRGGILHVSLLR